MTDLALDYLGLDALLSPGELAWRDTVRTFVRDRITPNIKTWYEQAVFPAELVPEMGRLGPLGRRHPSGYGCPGHSAVEYGLAALELEAGGLGPAHLRQRAGLAGHDRYPQVRLRGAEAALAAGNGRGRPDRLLRPDRAGRRSDPAAMTTTARRVKVYWGLDHRRDQAVDRPGLDRRHRRDLGPDRGRRPRLPDPGRNARVHRHRDRAEAGHAGLDPVRHHAGPGSGCPADAMLPGAIGLRGPFRLNEARYGIIWGAMGAARDAYESALAYALQREQFGPPIASFQLTQAKLVDMVLEIQKGVLVALHIGRMKDAAPCDLSRSRSASSTTSGPPSTSPGRPGPSSGAMASRWTIRRCGTPATSRGCAPTRALMRCTC